MKRIERNNATACTQPGFLLLGLRNPKRLGEWNEWNEWNERYKWIIRPNITQTNHFSHENPHISAISHTFWHKLAGIMPNLGRFQSNNRHFDPNNGPYYVWIPDFWKILQHFISLRIGQNLPNQEKIEHFGISTNNTFLPIPRANVRSTNSSCNCF